MVGGKLPWIKECPNREEMESEGDFLPSLHVRGTFYSCGFHTGKTFKTMIEEYVEQSVYLKEELLPAYDTNRGQRIYQNTVELMQSKFPQYVRELQGISDGSQVPFHKLMLLHMDSTILPDSVTGIDHSLCNGCTTVMCNQEDVVLGHTEDALEVADNHCYIIHADITDSIDGFEYREKFSALCYAGHLPGFCMSVNQHGLVFTINVVQPTHIHADKTPRHFLTRALVSAKNFDEVETILRDVGTGCAHGLCVNSVFINQEPIVFRSTEVGPSEKRESQLSTVTVSAGECHNHCNQFLRLNIEEDLDFGVNSSQARHRVLDSYDPPKTFNDVIELLSNNDDDVYPIHRRGKLQHPIATIATGVFDFKRKLWLMYVGQPNKSLPIASFPLEI